MKQETMGWQWHQLDHMQIMCTLLPTDNHTSTSSLIFTGCILFLMLNQQCQSTELTEGRFLVCILLCTGTVGHFTSELIIVHRVSKNVPPLACYNFETHEWILIFFGRNVADKVGNQKMLYYATSSNLCFCTTWQNALPM